MNIIDFNFIKIYSFRFLAIEIISRLTGSLNKFTFQPLLL